MDHSTHPTSLLLISAFITPAFINFHLTGIPISQTNKHIQERVFLMSQATHFSFSMATLNTPGIPLFSPDPTARYIALCQAKEG
jgi:hypothetical protein